MTNPQVQIGRLAMRHEGKNWNAYYALPGSMEDAIFLGSICMSAIVNNSPRKEEFMNMMRDIVSEIIADKTGIWPTWGGPTSAPEHEKSGEA